MALARESGHHRMLVDARNGLAAVALARGHLHEARRVYEESRASFERLGTVGALGYATALVGLGNVALAKDDLAGAQEHFREALKAAACTAWEKMDAIAGLAEVTAGEGDACRAAELLSLVAAHPFTAHATRKRAVHRFHEMAANLPGDLFASAAARGRCLELDEVLSRLRTHGFLVEEFGSGSHAPEQFH